MIEDVTFLQCEKSDFIKPKRLGYRQDGIAKTWDMVDVHDSVAIILYHEERDSLVVVRQFRPPVYLKNGDGYTYELCAGIVDKDKSLFVITSYSIHYTKLYDLHNKAFVPILQNQQPYKTK